MKAERRTLIASLALSSLLAAGCGAADLGEVTLAVTQTPGDVSCLTITADGATRQTTRNFNLANGSSTATLNMHGIPTGSVTFTGSGYNASCGQINGASVATWLVVPQTVTITANVNNNFTLVLRRNGRATVGADFQDDQYTVSTIAGTAGQSGSADGVGAAARFLNPFGVVADGLGNLYVSDFDNFTIRKVVVATGAVTTIAGTPGSNGSVDGVGAAARFRGPTGLAFDGNNLYVADICSVRKVTLPGASVTTIAGSATCAAPVDGVGAGATFSPLRGVAYDGAGDLFSVGLDYAVRRIVIGTGAVSLLAGQYGIRGHIDGPGGSAQFDAGEAIAYDGAGNLFVADDSFSIRQVVISTAEVTTIAGLVGGNSGEQDGVGDAAKFNVPDGIVSDGSGGLFVSDVFGEVIRRVDVASAAVVTIAGSPNVSGSADGAGSAARFTYPGGLARDGAGIYVVDEGNDTIRMLSH